MRYIVRNVALLTIPSLLAGSVAAQVCHPVHPHKVAHATKAATPSASGLGVVVDQARLISFPKPVKTVFVGNPTIVDVSMQDPQHAFLLGKTFGVTNMIALGPDGKQISNQQITVHNNWAAVTVNRGSDQFNYMCTTAHCETAPRPGDPNTYVTNTEGASGQHETVATTAANSAPAQTAANNN